MKYRVTFTCYYDYEVDAENDYDAENDAYEKFKREMAQPIASVCYDDVDIECLDEEDE